MSVLDLKNKLLERAIMEYIDTIDNMSPEDLCIKIEEIREMLAVS